LVSTSSTTPARASPTPTANPLPTLSPSVVPSNNQDTVSNVAVGEITFYVVMAVAVIGLLVVLGYRFGKKQLVVMS
jgi:hypothetical protein